MSVALASASSAGATTGMRVPGKELPLLRDAAVGDDGDLGRDHAGGVQQRVPLGRGAVRGDPHVTRGGSLVEPVAQRDDHRTAAIGEGRPDRRREQTVEQLALDAWPRPTSSGSRAPCSTIV